MSTKQHIPCTHKSKTLGWTRKDKVVTTRPAEGTTKAHTETFESISQAKRYMRIGAIYK